MAADASMQVNDASSVCATSSNGVANGSKSDGAGNGDVPAHGPIRVAVLFAGRQASGGHNVIWGLHEFLKGTDSTVRGDMLGVTRRGRLEVGKERTRGNFVVCCEKRTKGIILQSKYAHERRKHV